MPRRFSPHLFGLRFDPTVTRLSAPGGLPRTFRFPWLRGGDSAARPRYSVSRQEDDVRFFTARGDHPRVTQILLEGIGVVPGSWGIVVVEVTPVAREWLAPSVSRPRVLEALLSIRDLLGQGHVDIAVFSPEHGVEFFLDRFATLEIRTGSWLEPRFRALLEAKEFRYESRLPVLPKAPRVAEWTEEDRLRLARARDALKCRTAPPRNRKTLRR